MRSAPALFRRLRYPDRQDILEGDYVHDEDNEHFIVEHIDTGVEEVHCLRQHGAITYRHPSQLTLIDRE